MPAAEEPKIDASLAPQNETVAAEAAEAEVVQKKPAVTPVSGIQETEVAAAPTPAPEAPRAAEEVEPVHPADLNEFEPDPDFDQVDSEAMSPEDAMAALQAELSPRIPGPQPDPFALRPEKTGPDLAAQVFEISKDGQELPVADYETPQELKEASVTRMMNPLLNSISNGDDLHIPSRPKRTLEEELADLGFPPRPHLWPHMMAWPPRRDMELLHKKGLTRENLDEYLSAQRVRQLRMLERCAVINEWLDQHNPNPGFGYKNLDKKSRSEAYGGIQWACLLDENAAKDAVASSVLSWGRHRVRTRDGGQTRAHKDFVAVNKVTEQSLTLAIFEARARGWNTLRIAGGPEFAKQAMVICRKYNISAEVTSRVGPFKRVFHVSPNLPGAVEVEPDAGGGMSDKKESNASLQSGSGKSSEPKRLAIPDSGVEGMPRSPFAAGSTDMGRDIDDLEDPFEEERPLSARLAFGEPLDNRSGKTRERAPARTPKAQDKDEPVIDV